MSDNEIYVQGEPVPYGVYEMAQARNERREKRLWIAILLAVALLFASNAIWLHAWMSYDYVSETIEASQDGEGVNIIGGGNVTHGTNGDDQTENTP